jgi:hypothetical protein
MTEDERVLAGIRAAAEAGTLISDGWKFFQLGLRDGVNAQDRADLQTAFFTGAGHIFHSMMKMFDGNGNGLEATAADTRRIHQIEAELRRFVEGNGK